MYKIYAGLLGVFLAAGAQAQISVTSSDMPVNGDTLRWSTDAAALASINTSNTGANQTWDYSMLNATAQGMDAYKKASQVNILYAATIGTTAYGYKVGDSIPGLGGAGLPISISDIYTFFEKKNNPSRFNAVAFAANISGIPTPANYNDDDEWYYFPLGFGNMDTSAYKVTIGFAGIGSITLNGNRTTNVDGWGTIQTPFYTTAEPALRIRTQTDEVDSVDFGGTTFGLPRQTVEYKWLTNTSHYPALWITSNVVAGNEVPSSARYRDTYRTLGIGNTPGSRTQLAIAPNPAGNSDVRLALPAAWKSYVVEVYDATGRLMLQQMDRATISAQGFGPGNYLVRAYSGSQVGFAKFVK